MAERSGIPEPHASFLRSAIARLREDARLVGVGAGGSYLAGTMDEFSDLDLVIAVEPAAVVSVRDDRQKIARSLAPLLAAFTGEHVGEPRLLICLFGPPLLHVDLKFVRLSDASSRVEDPAVLWERDGRLSAALRVGRASFPKPDLAWIEEGFWVGVRLCAAAGPGGLRWRSWPGGGPSAGRGLGVARPGDAVRPPFPPGGEERCPRGPPLSCAERPP